MRGWQRACAAPGRRKARADGSTRRAGGEGERTDCSTRQGGRRAGALSAPEEADAVAVAVRKDSSKGMDRLRYEGDDRRPGTAPEEADAVAAELLLVCGQVQHAREPGLEVAHRVLRARSH